MSKAQVIHELGAPEVMQWQEWPVPDPEPGEVRLRHSAIGVNFADTYHRGGISHPWPVPPCPTVIGFEGVGFVVVRPLGLIVRFETIQPISCCTCLKT